MNFAWILFVAASSGAIALSYEIVWYRAYSFVSWSSPTAFGLVLGAYLLGIALGSAIARVWCTRRQDTRDRRHLLALAIFVAMANLVSYAVVPELGKLVLKSHWVESLVWVTFATTCLGAILPLTSHIGVSPDERAGKNLSYIYLANILGSAAGSLMTGFVLMQYFSLRAIHVMLVFAGTSLAGVILLRAAYRPIVSVGGVIALFVLAVGTERLSHRQFTDIYARLLFKNDFSHETVFSQVIENRSGVITVTPNGAVYGSGAYDGQVNTNLIDDRNGIVRAFVAGVLRPNPKNVLMIGLSTGSWAQVVAHHPGVEHLTVIEINPGYIELIERYPEVAGVLRNPKVSIVMDDGRRWLQRNPDRRFDAIVMNTTWHFRSNATNLLSREFLELMRTHLEAGGFAFYNTTGSEAVLKTGCTVFPHCLRFSNFLAVGDGPLVIDEQRFEKLLLEYRIEGQPVFDPSRPEHQEALTKFRTMIRQAVTRDKLLEQFATTPIVTDDNMYSEWTSTAILRNVDPVRYFREEWLESY